MNAFLRLRLLLPLLVLPSPACPDSADWDWISDGNENLWSDLVSFWKKMRVEEPSSVVHRRRHAAAAAQEEEEEDEEGKAVKGSTLAFVFDSTGSMRPELDQVKVGAAKILQMLRERPDVPIHNYIMVPFNDPDIGPVTVTTNHSVFKESIHNITAFGGGDCEEMSVGAIKKALALGLPGSYVYVFTDASAKDHRLQNEVLALVQKKQSQVNFVLTDHCGDTTDQGFQVYERISETSSGQMYRLDKPQVKDVLASIKASLKPNVVNLLSEHKPAPEGNAPDEHGVLVDRNLEEFTVSVSGTNASISVTDPEGKNVDGPPKLESVLHLDNAKIVNVKEPDPGTWKVYIRSESDYRLRSTGLSKVNFNHGFSAVDTSNMKETNYRPLKGTDCYLLIETSDASKVHNISTVDVLDLRGDVLKRLRLEPDPGKEGLYKTTPFKPPSSYFYLGIAGYGEDGLPIRRTTATAISAQVPEKPAVVLRPEAMEVALRERAELRCFVESAVPVTIQWYKDGKAIAGPKDCRQTCEVSFAMETTTAQSAGNYTCLASNEAGISKSSSSLTVRGPPVVQVRRHATAVAGETIRLDCFVECVGACEVSWSRVPSLPIRGKRLGNNSLALGPLLPQDEGWYVCSAEDSGGRTKAGVMLHVSVPVSVHVDPEKVSYRTGDRVRLSCAASGRPRPKLEWRIPVTRPHLSEEINGRLSLVIESAARDDNGTYVCFAENEQETATATAELVYTEEPRIRAENKTIVTKDGAEIELACSVAGEPSPAVTWHKNGEEIESGARFQVDGGRLRISPVRLTDAGEFSCTARNSLGADVDYIGLFVGTSPTLLQTPKDKSIGIGERATLSCSALGIPSPEVTWRRSDGTELDAKRVITLQSGGLRFLRMSVEDVGAYVCTATNSFGSVSAEVKIDVHGVERPATNDVVSLSEVMAIAGSDVRVPCGVTLGNPPGKVTWLRNGLPVANATVDDEGGLLLRETASDDRGNYTCVVSNVAGNSSRSFLISVSESPRMSSNATTRIKAQKGGEIVIPCPAEGYPVPSITWTKNGEPLPMSPTIFQDENGSLIIRNLDEENSGTYVCTGHNAIGSTSKAITVQVQVPPTFVDEGAVQSVNIVEGYVIVLDCTAKGEPTMRWYKNGEPFIRMDEDQVRPQVLRFVATVDDAGLYKCVASNDVGTASKEFNVSVLVPPSMIESGNGDSIKARAGLAMTLECKVRGVPPPKILWQRNGMYLTQNTSEVTLTDSGLLVLRNVTTESAGTYVCDAENLAGIVQSMFYLQVLYGPRIAEDGGELELAEGQEESLPCTVEGNPKPFVVWRKNGFLADGRGVMILGDNTLVILQAKKNDSGVYRCEATNEEGSASREYNVTVRTPPSVSPDSYHSRKKANEGEPVVLICPVSNSVPPPTIQWIKDGKPLNALLQERSDEAPMKLSEDQRVLTIPEVHPIDRGNYSCTATNSAGRADAKFIVDVLMTPHFEEFNHVAHRTILVGGEVTLNCSVSGNPHPKITWRKGDQTPITPESSPGVHVTLDGQYLLIPNGRLYHSGTYVCTAVNEVSRKEREFYVSVLEPPNMVGALHEDLEVVAAGNITLHCPATGVPPPDIAWHRNQSKLNASSERLQLWGVSCDDDGAYHCEATNSVGSKTKTFNLTVLEPPDVDSENVVEDVVTHVGRNVSLSCRVRGHPRPEVTWLHNGRILRGEESKRRRRNAGYSVVALDLVNVTEDDQGEYTALASNRAGVAEKTFRVAVLRPPAPSGNGTDAVTAVRGFPAVLECPLSGYPAPEVRWFRGREAVAAGDDVEFFGRELRIRRADEDHSGVYVCVAENAAGKATADVVMTVIGPPRLKSVEERYTVRANDTLELACEGPDDVRYTWLRKSAPVFNSSKHFLADNKLVVAGAALADSGVYVCIATNVAGSTKASFHVDVIEPPAVLSSVSSSASVEVYHPFSLTCPVSSRPPANITWYKEGKELRREGPILTVASATMEDAGRYECVAANAAGNLTLSYNVTVSAKEWGSWSPWSDYSVTCGRAVRRRHRNCNAGTCDGSSVEEEIRTLRSCDGEWSEWSDCSRSCGGGLRGRKCTQRPCRGPAVMRCNEDACPGEWSEWSPCSVTCGQGQRKRHRKCSTDDCAGENLQIEKCVARPCGRGPVPKTAKLNVRGEINGRAVDENITVDIESRDKERRISASMHRLVDDDDGKWFPYNQFLLSPLAWSAAYEADDSDNGYSLTNGRYFSLSDIKFATGEGLKVKHQGEGVDADGALRVEIEVIGEAPLVEPYASIAIQGGRDMVQTSPNSIHSLVQNDVAVDGEKLPYRWNSSIYYDSTRGRMPHLVEKLSVKDISNSYDPETNNIKYVSSSTIQRGRDKCPEGFVHNAEHLHCEDVDECEPDGICGRDGVCENTFGSFRCLCRDGYVSRDSAAGCVDVDECRDSKLCSHFCHNAPGSFSCSCPYGYYLGEDLRTCRELPFAYRSGNSSSDESGELMAFEGRGTTACPPGFSVFGNECRDDDECLEDDICDDDELCLNTLGSYQCLSIPCPEGFHRDALSNCARVCPPCRSKASVSESVIFEAVTLSTGRAYRDILQLDVRGRKGVVSKFRVVEARELFRVRESGNRAFVYAARSLNKDTLYRLKVEARSFADSNHALMYLVEFTIFVIVI